jgi:hypothetical protein
MDMRSSSTPENDVQESDWSDEVGSDNLMDDEAKARIEAEAEKAEEE